MCTENSMCHYGGGGGGVRFLRFLRFEQYSRFSYCFLFVYIYIFFFILLRHFPQTLSTHIVVCDVIYAAAYDDDVVISSRRPAAAASHRIQFFLPVISLSSSPCFSGISALSPRNTGHGLVKIIRLVRLIR